MDKQKVLEMLAEKILEEANRRTGPTSRDEDLPATVSTVIDEVVAAGTALAHNIHSFNNHEHKENGYPDARMSDKNW